MTPSRSPKTLPAEYQLLEEIQLSQSLAVKWAAIAFAAFFLSLFLSLSVYTALTGEESLSFELRQNQWATGILTFLLFGVLYLATIPIHELIHGAVMRLYGGRPRYGMGIAHFLFPYAYATSNQPFSRNQFIQIALAPLVVISVVGFLLMLLFNAAWIAILLAANASGAVGDLWVSLSVLHYPCHVRVEDHKTGLRIYGKPTDQRIRTSPNQFFWNSFMGAIACVGILSILLSSILPIALGIAGVDSFSLGIPGFLELAQYQSTADSSSMQIRFDQLLILSGTIGLLYGLIKAIR
ncbi:MAG: DUF3267 domain-containing protein [Leptolyngbyaceae cyanobacterium RM1_406_9]|nr:DUF3267 domain-containing protein [Leptolyngbyaceae cyanobacterium RM1_406_9]